MNILVLNAGSSSLKYQLVDMDTEEVITRGLCERVGTPSSFHKHGVDSDERVIHRALPDHRAAVEAVLGELTHPEHGEIADLSEIQGIGHRVVHGGDYFAESVVITDEVIARIEECAQLAPLHNPAALAGIQACRRLMSDKVQVATFDTAFHQSMPPKAYRYPLPPEYYERHRIRRYGFHGTSHRYVAEQAALFMNRPLSELKLITCHLGNGCSLTAIDGGRSVDTTMGFTPLEGLMMGTRSGSIDPAIVLYLIDELGMDTAEVNALLNRLSGLLGVSQSSNDLRDVADAAKAGNAEATLALELYAYAVLRALGSYVFVLGGVDAIVFTAGVGENSSEMRQRILAGLEDLGICLDPER
ncbi:MAG: acetate kinase, partial [Coriobacteriales bacterium]|nr:acetate kinase [Coriobacteriales bacterium]